VHLLRLHALARDRIIAFLLYSWLFFSADKKVVFLNELCVASGFEIYNTGQFPEAFVFPPGAV
jgi:hypothetical protein